jgi:hypothetical protein
MKILLGVIIAIGLIGSASAGVLPDSKLTPGDINSVLTKERICAPGFRTRPFRRVTQKVHREAFTRYGVICKRGNGPRTCGKLYEVDHLISLEIGGSNSIKNLWPQAYAGKCGARVKDVLEDKLHQLVCHNSITLEEAQTEIRTDWTIAFKKYFNKSCES